MGMTVAAKLIDINRLKENILKEVIPKSNQLSVDNFVDKVLPVCGEVRYFGVNKVPYCLVIHADYWDDYDAYFTLMDVIERYYGISNGYDIVSEAIEVEADEGAETYEVFEIALGIGYDDVPKHPDDKE